MPSVAVKLYSVYFKLLFKHKLQSQIQTLTAQNQNQNQGNTPPSPFGITSRPDESTAPANPSFLPSSSSAAADVSSSSSSSAPDPTSAVATKDIHIDPLTSLSVRIFLPDSILKSNHTTTTTNNRPGSLPPTGQNARRSSYGSSSGHGGGAHDTNAELPRRSSFDGAPYRGYHPTAIDAKQPQPRKLPIVLQFHGGAFVSGSNVSVATDLFCRRIAKLLDVIVIAVGYRLAPESRYPAAFEDGMKVVHWLGKQANLAVLKGGGNGGGRGGETKRGKSNWRIVDTFGAATVEPWLAAHGDPTR